MKFKNRVTKAAVVSLTAGALVIGGLGFAGTAFADGPRGVPGQPQPSAQQAPRPGQGQGNGAALQQAPRPAWLTSDLEAIAAQQIGISKTELSQQMAQGSSIAQIAARHGVTFAVLKTTLVNAGDADLQKATAAGSVSQSDANQIVSTIPQMVEGFLNRGANRARNGGPAFSGPPSGAPSGQRTGPAPMGR